MQIKRGNRVIADVHLMDSSYITEEIMGEHSLILNFRTLEPIELEIHDYVLFQGIEYRIRHHERIQKVMKDLGWEYSVKFYAEQYDLQDVLFFLNGKPERRKNADNFNGTARQMLDLIVENMNRVFSGWKAGDCLETHTETFNFKDKKCSAVLDDVVKTFETEYWIAGKTINIGKREYDNFGLYLGQGEGMGFRDLDLTAVDEKPPVTVLYPYGSDKNLTTGYGSDYLLMPDGKLSLEKNIDTYGRFEEAVSFDHIFPTKECTVTAKIDDCILQSTDIDFDLKECLIDEVDVIVTFQSGGLAGYDLAIIKDTWDNTTKQFELKKNDEENALTVPGDIHFNVGDRFILTGIKMPQKYIDEAEIRLEQEAQKYLDEHCEKRVQLSGKCDDILFRKKRYYIRCGQMIHIISEKLNIDREIRVTKVKRYLENNEEQPYRYELTLSDFLQSNGFKDLVDDIKKMPDEIVNHVNPLKMWSKRTWRDTKETMNMLGKSFLNFSSSIDPITVNTMQLLVGDPSLQFQFVDNKSNPTSISYNINYHPETKVLNIPSGILQHMTLGIKDISNHLPEDYMFWDIISNSILINEPEKSFYIYIKASKTSSSAEFIISEKAIKIEEKAEAYHFLYGILNSEYEGKRSLVELYGFVEILPGRITANRIVSTDGNNFIDFLNNSVRIGNKTNYIDFNSDGKGTLKIRGSIVQNSAGDESPLGVFRGVWNISHTYYPGDTVTYYYNGGTSTYRFIYGESASGIYPTTSSYWQIVSSQGSNGSNGSNGKNGEDGSYFEYRYAQNGSRTNPPNLNQTTAIPSGWSTTMPNNISLQYIWCTVAQKRANGTLISYWSNPTRITGADGTDGDRGPSVVYRGIYESNKTYYGTANRVDAVKYNNIHYIARSDAGNGFSGQAPLLSGQLNTRYWNEFGAEFESVATNLLLADKIIVDNLTVKNLQTSIGSERIEIDQNRNTLEFYCNNKLGIEVTGEQDPKGARNPAILIHNTIEGGAAFLELCEAGLVFRGLGRLKGFFNNMSGYDRIVWHLPDAKNAGYGEFYQENGFVKIKN